MWTSRWVASLNDSALRLDHIAVDQYEEVVQRTDTNPWFAECTESVLGANASYREQLLQGTNEWRARLLAKLDVDLFGHQGIALGDVNGGGLDEFFVCQPGGLPNRLFLHNRDGTATDVSAEAGVDYLDRSRSALFVDLDNDRDQALVVASAQGQDGLKRQIEAQLNRCRNPASSVDLSP